MNPLKQGVVGCAASGKPFLCRPREVVRQFHKARAECLLVGEAAFKSLDGILGDGGHGALKLERHRAQQPEVLLQLAVPVLSDYRIHPRNFPRTAFRHGARYDCEPNPARQSLKKQSFSGPAHMSRCRSHASGYPLDPVEFLVNS